MSASVALSPDEGEDSRTPPPEGAAPPSASAAGVPRTLKIAVACMLAAFFFEELSSHTALDPDSYHEMALFRHWLRTGVFPAGDVFAFTHTVFPSVHHEWGAGALMYGYVTLLGGTGVMLIRWLLSIGIAALATRLALRRGAAVTVAFCAPLALVLGEIGFTTIRAGVYTSLLLTIFLTMIDDDRERPRPLGFIAAYVALMIVWINLHAGWVVGLIAVGCHLTEQLLRRRPIRHLVAALATTPALLLATPYGRAYPHGWWRSISYARDKIFEWDSLLHTKYFVGVIGFAVAAALTLYAVVRRGPKRMPGLLFLLASGFAAWRHQRHLAFFAIAWFVTMPEYLAPTLLRDVLASVGRRARVARAVVRGSVPVVIALLVVAARQHPMTLVVPTTTKGDAGGPVAYPSGAVDYLSRAHFRGKLVTEFATGAYVSWKMHPDVQVSLDGRYEVAYADGVLEEHQTLYGALSGWREVLARYQPDAILLEPSDPLKAALAATTSTGLARVYADDVYEVWARRELGLPFFSREAQPIPSFVP